ncbi:MAG TPA: hypothetical protein VK826_15020 [Bacteroidia bacterium]|nr:hypothetical protein [Bacteroidia bacterium]
MKTFYSPALAALSILACVAIFPSCKSVYHPNAVNTPLFNNAGEIRATVDPGNVQLAYAVTDHAGIMLNGFRVKENTEDNAIRGRGGLVEVGFGYYTRFRPFVFETYIGGGMGMVHFDETRQENNTTTIRSFEARGTRFFVQPSFGYTSRFFDVALTPRFVFGKYSNIVTNYSTQEQIDGKFYAIDRPLWAFIEPALTVRGGYQWIKLQVQFGISQKLNSEALSYKDTFLNVGLSFNINHIYE